MSNISGKYTGFLNGIFKIINYDIIDPIVIFDQAPITLNFTKAASDRYSVNGETSINIGVLGFKNIKIDGVAQYNSSDRVINMKLLGVIELLPIPIVVTLSSSIDLSDQYCTNKLLGTLDFVPSQGLEVVALIGEAIYNISVETD